jgi:hypothetical protein
VRVGVASFGVRAPWWGVATAPVGLRRAGRFCAVLCGAAGEEVWGALDSYLTADGGSGK